MKRILSSVLSSSFIFYANTVLFFLHSDMFQRLLLVHEQTECLYFSLSASDYLEKHNVFDLRYLLMFIPLRFILQFEDVFINLIF